ncbi:hypothetical protein ACJX0J_012691, partial [Zea mays]
MAVIVSSNSLASVSENRFSVKASANLWGIFCTGFLAFFASKIFYYTKMTSNLFQLQQATSCLIQDAERIILMRVKIFLDEIILATTPIRGFLKNILHHNIQISGEGTSLILKNWMFLPLFLGRLPKVDCWVQDVHGAISYAFGSWK